MILLNAEQGMKVSQICQLVREDERTVQRWLHRYQAEGIQGLYDLPRPGTPAKVTAAYQQELLESVRQRPRALGLEFSLWTLDRMADYMAERTGIRISYETVRQHLKDGGIVLSRPQYKVSSPDPEYAVKKKRSSRKESN
jgi:transposase